MRTAIVIPTFNHADRVAGVVAEGGECGPEFSHCWSFMKR